MTSPAGWHPDPVPPHPGQPPQLRYWDGSRWTEHVAPGQPATTAFPYAAQPGAATTPDGVPLASWGQRAGALLIDWLIVSVAVGVLSIPWASDVFHSYRHFVDDFVQADRNGTARPTGAQLQHDIAGPLRAIALISLAFTFVYHVGFLTWRQATPGKLALGLRVRLRDRPGRLPLGAVLLRWLGQFGVRAIGLVPVVGALASLYLLLDYLWPLWDGQRQALHEKLPRTNVVRTR